MKFYRLIGLFLLFGVLMGVNFFLIASFQHSMKVKRAQAQILAQIEAIDNEPIDDVGIDSIQSDIKLTDGRAAKLRRYLRSLNSPLFDYADLLVEEADKFGYDYRLLVAIALQESTACKFIPDNSYNCWGWGIYGNTITRFGSYDEAIKTVSAGIKKNYLDKGLITTEQIMHQYTPSSNGSWSRAVRYFFHRIDTF